MKTTVEIPDELFRQAKAHAALQGKTLKELFIVGLRLAMDTSPESENHIAFPIIESGQNSTLSSDDVASALSRMDLEEDRDAGLSV